MPSEQFRETMSRIRAGLRRKLTRGALLEDPEMHSLQQRLLELAPRELTQQAVAETRFVVIDTETTGLKAYAGDEIVSISLLELEGIHATGREFSTLINPGRDIPESSVEIHHIRNEDVADAPVLEEVLLEVVDFIDHAVLVGHHIGFDIRFLNRVLHREMLCHLKHPWLDTMLLYLAASGRVGHYSLEDVANFSQVEIHGRHTAHGDAVTAAKVFRQLVGHLGEFTSPVQLLIDRQFELGHF